MPDEPAIASYATYLLSRLRRAEHPMFASDLYTATKHRHQSRQTFYDVMRSLVRDGQVTQSHSRTGGLLFQAVTKEPV